MFKALKKTIKMKVLNATGFSELITTVNNSTKIRQFNENPLFKDIYTQNSFAQPLVCTSQLCNQDFFGLPLFQYWTKCMNMEQKFHRKTWEHVYIAHALWDNGFLTEGNSGLGFAVGMEPLPALFASRGCKITATDLDVNVEQAKSWVKTGQHIGGTDKRKLNQDRICPDELFEGNVEFRNADMNHIPDSLTGYDFVWSSCALEHLGGMEKSLDFICNSLNTVRSGGLAVHTTEFNLSSDEELSPDPYCCILRKKDIVGISEKLTKLGHYVYPLDFRLGTCFGDKFVDIPPYKQVTHLRLSLFSFVSTSFGIIVRKK
jgi:hypothetical protein